MMNAGNNGPPARNPNPNIVLIGEPVKMDVDATQTKEGYMMLVNVPGNPWVLFSYPYPYPSKPLSVPRGKGSRLNG